MKKSRILLILLLLAGVLLVLLLALGAGGYYLYQQRMADTREASTPPGVFVHTPTDGDTFLAGNTVIAQVSASGVNPIARVEMWLDGELFDTRVPDPASTRSLTSLRFTFEFQMDEGLHLLSWRAVDFSGLVGASAPIGVLAQTRSDADTTTVKAEDGQTLDEVSAEQGADIGAVEQLNPGLETGNLAGGTSVVVPKPPLPAAPGPAPSPAAPAQPPVDILPPAPLPTTPPGIPPLPSLTMTTTFPTFQNLTAVLLPAMIAGRPKAPGNLEAGFENCTIRLTWVDNADNETHFKVWMQRLGGPPQLIATLAGSPATGPAWYEFKSPSLGIYSFWIEAVNALGGQSSEMKGVAVNDPNCKDAIATKLVIEGLDMFVGGGFDKVYCYLSLEGAAAQRLPGGDAYFQVFNQWGDISKHWGGDKSLLLPIPADEQVSLEGECLGWGASTPVSLGTFQANVPREQWDGRRLEVKGANFIVGYRIYPHGDTQAQGLFFYTDYTIPPPRILGVEKEKPKDANDLVEDVLLARRPIIHWEWGGDQSQITTFSVYLDGKLLQWAENEWRKTRLLLPGGCGQTYQLTMTANTGEAQSVPSQPFEYKTPPCPLMAEVHFQSIYAHQTDDRTLNPFDVAGSLPYAPCDQLSIYGELWATSATYEVRHLGSENITYPFTCNVNYDFKTLGFDEDTLVVPIDPVNPTLRFGTVFWEYDFWSDDVFGRVMAEAPTKTLDQWRGFDQVLTFNPPDYDDTAIVTIKIRVRAFEFSE